MNSAVRPRPSPIYAIADAEALAPRGLSAAVVEMAEAGLELIQLRAKRLADRDLYREAEACLRALEGWTGALWIDDRVDVAAALPFSGVHLGQEDLPVAAVRELLRGDRAVGLSTHGREQLLAADRDPAADWIALGPIFPTSSKRNADPVIGIEGLSALRRETRKPLIAIGGIDADNLRSVLAAGADAVAVLAAVCRGDIGANCRLLAAVARP